MKSAILSRSALRHQAICEHNTQAQRTRHVGTRTGGDEPKCTTTCDVAWQRPGDDLAGKNGMMGAASLANRHECGIFS